MDTATLRAARRGRRGRSDDLRQRGSDVRSRDSECGSGVGSSIRRAGGGRSILAQQRRARGCWPAVHHSRWRSASRRWSPRRRGAGNRRGPCRVRRGDRVQEFWVRPAFHMGKSGTSARNPSARSASWQALPATAREISEGGFGLQHIVAKRSAVDGINGNDWVRERLPEVLARGHLVRLSGPGIGRRSEIVLGRDRVLLSLMRDGRRETWVVTGYEMRSPPGENRQR
jgi:hypothetical protein